MQIAETDLLNARVLLAQTIGCTVEEQRKIGDRIAFDLVHPNGKVITTVVYNAVDNKTVAHAWLDLAEDFAITIEELYEYCEELVPYLKIYRRARASLYGTRRVIGDNAQYVGWILNRKEVADSALDALLIAVSKTIIHDKVKRHKDLPLEDRDNEICNLYVNKNISAFHIAEKYNMSRQRVNQILRSKGVAPQHPRIIRETADAQQKRRAIAS